MKSGCQESGAICCGDGRERPQNLGGQGPVIFQAAADHCSPERTSHSTQSSARVQDQRELRESPSHHQLESGSRRVAFFFFIGSFQLRDSVASNFADLKDR